MIFIGPLFAPECENEIIINSKHGVMNASNQFQVDLLQGFLVNNVDMRVINALPVGTWPSHYRKLILPDEEWCFGNAHCNAVGCVNLPVIKQWQREVRVRKMLKKMTMTDKEIVIYSAYLPFLRAVEKLPAEVKVTLIVPDLPEFYDLGKTSGIRRMLRRMNNRLIDRCLQRVDRYVLLTEQMAEKLGVQDKPYTVVEGIWNAKNDVLENLPEAGDAKVIFYAGTLHRKYGIETLLDAFALVKDPKAQLWICGSGDMAEEICKRAQKDTRIQYKGYVSSEEVACLRKKATVLVNPRSNEGEFTKYSFPSKTMGYMASGKPVVMNKLDGIPDEYDQFLIYATDNSHQALADALQTVLDMSNEERIAVGSMAKEFVNTKKTPYIQAKKILDLAEKLF